MRRSRRCSEKETRGSFCMRLNWRLWPTVWTRLRLRSLQLSLLPTWTQLPWTWSWKKLRYLFSCSWSCPVFSHLDFSNVVPFVWQEQLDTSNNMIKMLQMQKAQISKVSLFFCEEWCSFCCLYVRVEQNSCEQSCLLQVGEYLQMSEAELRTPDVPEEELVRSVQSLTVEDVYT